MKVKEKKVFGIGINNADYQVSRKERVNGRWRMAWRCPYYARWMGMLARCRSVSTQRNRPTYKGCSICPEWVYFMTFRAWMMQQDWEGRQLDKDLLVEGNRVYGPETCRFIDQKLNTFLSDNKARRGEYPLGVHWCNTTQRMIAKCWDSFSGKVTLLGYPATPEEGHLAWLRYKHQLACRWADLQEDEAIASALRKRYDPEIVLGKS
jgi:hypothetical protein